MQISSPEKKKFLLALIEQANFPGHMMEFVLSVKQEVRAAAIVPSPDITRAAPPQGAERSLLEQCTASGQVSAGQQHQHQHQQAGELPSP